MTEHASVDSEAVWWRDNSEELEALEATHGRVIHRCPPEGEGLFPCCGHTPFEVPRWHRVTLDPKLVTCGRDDA